VTSLEHLAEVFKWGLGLGLTHDYFGFRRL
jgi:hypothetical protein